MGEGLVKNADCGWMCWGDRPYVQGRQTGLQMFGKLWKRAMVVMGESRMCADV